MFIWVYRRYFATIAARCEEFETFCSTRPLVAKVLVSPGSEGELTRQLAERLGPRAEVIPTLAGWPWAQHVLKVELSCTPGAILLTIAGCRGLRLQERPLPALTELLFDFMLHAREQAETCWLCRDAFCDVLGEVNPEAGWRLLTDRPRNQCVEPVGG